MRENLKRFSFIFFVKFSLLQACLLGKLDLDRSKFRIIVVVYSKAVKCRFLHVREELLLAVYILKLFFCNIKIGFYKKLHAANMELIKKMESVKVFSCFLFSVKIWCSYKCDENCG